jgi:hypothetical protein
MYQMWRRGVAAGREPTGVDLAHAAGRVNDASGVGRRAARRYRDAHAAPLPVAAALPGQSEAAAATAVPPVAAVAAAPAPDAAVVRHNGSRPTLTGASTGTSP